ncbi:MAG: CapA family protein [Salinigranum sp.]
MSAPESDIEGSAPRRLGFAGDVMLGRLVDRYQHSRPAAAVWDDLLPTLRTLDGLFVNLECALSTRGSEWTETYRPFHFRADPEWAIPALSLAGVDCCSLANNHLLDFGPEALADTLDHLDRAGIARVGAGRDRGEAFAPAVVSVRDLDVSVVSITDNTPEYAAGPDSPGVARAEFDLSDEESRSVLARAVDRALATDPDLLVASLHWGPNMVTEPPRRFREVGRWLVERGADVVHGHSAHVFQGVEIHRGRPILYDAGDFVDDYAVDETLRNDRSFLFEVRVRGDGTPVELRLSPTEIADCAVHPASEAAAAWSRERVATLSRSLGTAFVEEDGALVTSLLGG